MITVNMYHPIAGSYVWVGLYENTNAQKINEFMRMWKTMRPVSQIRITEKIGQEDIRLYEGRAADFPGI